MNTLEQLDLFIDDCAAVGLHPERMRDLVGELVAYHKQPAQARSEAVYALEQDWYRSVERGKPDYEVYGTDVYVADLWACWLLYSRKYLHAIEQPASMPPDGVAAHVGDPVRIADLGCGIGLSTARLREMFPESRVVGTNLDGIAQTDIARRVASRAGFKVVSELHQVGSVGLVFASEYFEHFQQPLDHLSDVIDTLLPRFMLTANTFGSRSVGHFDWYMVDGKWVDGRTASRRFGQLMRERGYRRVETKLWNNRPAFWELAS